jgi:UDP-N-acetylglucosamine 2-epimerase
MKKKKLALILGIRPDVIRASLILQKLRADPECDLRFIWSGQHYSDNMKDVFFRDLGVQPPDIELGAGGDTDAEISSAVVARLSPVLQEMQPEAAVFLGDTNTVVGCLAAAQLNIPIVHIEGCMRSYDWRMPEEKYRTVIDHLADVVYTYFDEYKAQGVAEGLNPASIIVVGNPIVDVLEHHYVERKSHYDKLADAEFFASRGIEKSDFYVMTCHRRENVDNLDSLKAILAMVAEAGRTVYFPASYRTQKILRANMLSVPDNVIMVDPVGYQEFLLLLVNSRGALTDSGTVVEETCVLQVPALQIRKSTERPQVYDAGSCVKFDPAESDSYNPAEVFRKLEALFGKRWTHTLGDGQSSQRIADDLLQRVKDGRFRRHAPSDYHLDISRSYRNDGLS